MSSIDPDALGFLISDVSRLIRLSMDRAHAANGIGVTPGEARVLAFAARTGPARQNRLAELIGMEAMTLSGHLDALENKGLICRKPDPADRRAKIVHLLPEADPVLVSIRAAGQNILERASVGFDQQQWSQLAEALKHVRANLGALDREKSDAQ